MYKMRCYSRSTLLRLRIGQRYVFYMISMLSHLLCRLYASQWRRVSSQGPGILLSGLRRRSQVFLRRARRRWTEFARLTYFDIIQCSVIDPMHNLLQGAVKNQWFSRWIKTSALRPATDRRRCELSKIHDFMDSVSHSLFFEWII
jgi:hypothetical protein